MDQNKSLQNLKISFCALVLLLAVYQFSENTADPDLWGHVIFGQEMLQSHGIPKAEMYSWTAVGQPWINHESIAEISLGGVHKLWGGSGLLLLKMVMGLLTFWFALRMAVANISWPARFIAWGFGALAVVEISYGFPARPQIFTGLCLIVELVLLRQIHNGSRLWALALPALFAFWINTHGGALAGYGLLGLAAGMTTLQFLYGKYRGKGLASDSVEATNIGTAITLWLSVVSVTAALFCNPWGGELLSWLIGSVLWLRPEIEEWNPTPLGWDHAALFILVGLTAFAWACTRRKRSWWELAVCAAFALLALRSVRNAPLFGIVALALVPAHLVDALSRFRQHFQRWEILGGQASFQKFATICLSVISFGIGVATFTLHKEHPLTMEVPRSHYPTAAVDFLRENEMGGKMLVFFDWGEEVIFHLPNCLPSIDGRLDTCYSRELIAAHWKLYNAQPVDPKVLDINQADIALLPSYLAGAKALRDHSGWKVIYLDSTAVILVRNIPHFPKLLSLQLPVEGAKSAALGRAAFADLSPRWTKK
ncbi:MAG: hypothetical protein JWQ71_2017 [Pedosphaera sp.]|nr:hypothetical protein [Pedosphaera sp.]